MNDYSTAIFLVIGPILGYAFGYFRGYRDMRRRQEDATNYLLKSLQERNVEVAKLSGKNLILTQILAGYLMKYEGKMLDDSIDKALAEMDAQVDAMAGNNG